jgi:hypothetical protein
LAHRSEATYFRRKPGGPGRFLAPPAMLFYYFYPFGQKISHCIDDPPDVIMIFPA